MSAALSPTEPTGPTDADGPREPEPSARPAGGRTLVVRRNAGLAALVGAAASAVSIAYLWRATASGAPLDWVLCLLLAVVAGVYLTQLVDARTALLVADELGVRLRFGHQWRGLPWEAVERVLVSPRRGLVRDGRLLFTPHHLDHAVDGLDARGRRAAALNRRLYGAALAVPISLTTRTSTPRDRLTDQLRVLSGGRTDVVGDLVTGPAETGTDETGTDETGTDETGTDQQTVRHVVAKPRRGVTASRVLPRVAGGSDPSRVDHGTQVGPGTHEGPGGEPNPGGAQVHPIARLGDPVEPLVVDEFVTRPAYDPVIGPELAAARHRVGLSVDELADRTRIRPHVIESIEVDDFAPCGGDFYARGHLRTLARVLGREPQPLMDAFNTRYATAPVNARKVFEAELATGMTGSVRGPSRGPSWAVLIGSVVVVALVWAVVRIFAAEPHEQLVAPVPTLDGSAGVATGAQRSGSGTPTAPVRTSLVASHDGSSVVVRDGAGKVVWAGTLLPGTRRTLTLVPPVRVQAQDAGAVDVWLAGRDLGPVGTLGTAGRHVYHRPAAR